MIKKDFIISRVISSHLGSMYIETPYTNWFVSLEEIVPSIP